MRTGITGREGSAASTSEARKRKHHPRPVGVSFDEHRNKLATLAVDSFESLGRKGSDLVDQVPASIVGGTDGSSLARKGVCKERLFRIIPVNTQVANSRRVTTRHRSALRVSQAARRRKEEAGRLRSMTWGWNFDED